jgi:hypothetical protein
VKLESVEILSNLRSRRGRDAEQATSSSCGSKSSSSLEPGGAKATWYKKRRREQAVNIVRKRTALSLSIFLSLLYNIVNAFLDYLTFHLLTVLSYTFERVLAEDWTMRLD